MRVHFISIGGSVMHQLAIALHQKGYIITGSDDEVFEPSRTNLYNRPHALVMLVQNYRWHRLNSF